MRNVAVFLLISCGNHVAAFAQPGDETVRLVHQFEGSKHFWEQFEVAKALVQSKQRTVLLKLELWLSSPDRHARGNAALVFASLGDSGGFDVIVGILHDNAERPRGQGIGVAPSTPDGYSAAQVRADRYYAAHLLGDLKDPRGVPVLVSLLGDRDVKDIVPWSLAQIGDKRAVQPLIRVLRSEDPNMRVLAAHALGDLHATEARAISNSFLRTPAGATSIDSRR